MPTENKPLEKRLRPDEGDEEQKNKQESEDQTEQPTLLLTAKDAAALFEFSGSDIKQFRKLFALIADLCGRQGQQGQASQLPAAAHPRQPVLA